MSSLAEKLASRYVIIRELGAGGMATVYLARDVRHDREVAVKVLRSDIASAIGVERFLSEIKTTAHLQHPHILGLIDSGEVDGTVFYVMPFVKGESLRQRLDRELQIPVHEAVRIATQVASALDYAHRHGVIHRDIKPENILLHDEQALVADFGIALAATRAHTGTRMTEAGTSLGTPHYMSPEQAMGERTLDARADVYALGCVLYEMLTGEPPFDGPSAQAIIAKVMTADPEPVTTIRKTVPPNVAAATMMALSKLPADRFATASAFAAALENVQFSGPRHVASLVPHGAVLLQKKTLIGATIAALLVITTALIVVSKQSAGTDSGSVTRFEIALDAGNAPNQMRLTADGSALVWSGGGAIWERRLDSVATRRVRDLPQQTGTLRDLSPDGRFALASGRGLAVVPLAQGPARTLPVGGGRGVAAWSPDGAIYVSVFDARAIVRVNETGTTADTVFSWTGDRAIREIVPVPGRDVLLAIQDSPGRSDVDTLVAIDMSTGEIRALAGGASHVQFVPPDYVLYATSQYIMAARLNARELSLSEPVPYIEPGTAISALSASRNVLAYRPGFDQLGAGGMDVRSRAGARSLPGIPETLQFSGFTVSPDGRRVVALGTPSTPESGGQNANLYVYELPSGPLQRIPASENDLYPAWMPGGRDISFVRLDTAFRSTLMKRPWDGTGSAGTIAAGTDRFLGATSWSPGDRGVIQVGGQPGGRGRGGNAPFGGRGGPNGRGPEPQRGGGGRGPATDLMYVSAATGELTPFVASGEFSESSPAISPDGRFVAYVSNSSGRPEVYVSPFDASARRQVSRAGGLAPKWSRDGRNLFFRVTGGAWGDTLYSARVSAGAEIEVGEPAVVIGGVSLSPGYGVLPSDTAFVMRPLGSSARRPIVVIVNYQRELERLLSR
jgi:serine/threonine-protein kinase